MHCIFAASVAEEGREKENSAVLFLLHACPPHSFPASSACLLHCCCYSHFLGSLLTARTASFSLLSYARTCIMPASFCTLERNGRLPCVGDTTKVREKASLTATLRKRRRKLLEKFSLTFLHIEKKATCQAWFPLGRERLVHAEDSHFSTTTCLPLLSCIACMPAASHLHHASSSSSSPHHLLISSLSLSPPLLTLSPPPCCLISSICSSPLYTLISSPHLPWEVGR